ncbi:2TM domain-containing protein [Flavobacterium sp. 14A]|uniref:2TM domain-containing protein n=1 Tax=Flavobacterium sp. 14A TaxID=2735896 RepID=UPI00156DB84B|nr:2TM domain-containing protein [Flavobacterium sp. 14A]NRT13357.1 hypothetical protein [Flavobacterium sp. 14A]
MEKEQHELYEYARRRIKQKKGLYYHFVVLFLVSLFLFAAIKLFTFIENPALFIWILTGWIFLFLLHFVKVFITDRFMNKNWERDQIDRLVLLQQNKITELKDHVENTSNK